jgi:hypothetical protein
MGTFIWIGRDGARGAELRALHRPAHLAGLEPLAAEGRIRFAGPMKSPDGTAVGSVIILEAPDLEQARAIAARDPYATQGVFATWEVYETMAVFPR